MPRGDVSQLTGQDAATQQKRLEALNSTNALIISGSKCVQFMSENMKNQFRWMLEQGVKTYCVFHTKDHNIYKIMTDDKLYTEAIIADMDGEDAAKNIAEVANGLGIQFDGVFSPYEHNQPLVGEMSELLGVPGNPAKAYRIARDKHLTREALAAAGLNTPKSCEINDLQEVQNAADKVGFPMIVKPKAGAASLGVYRADSVQELATHVASILETLRTTDDLSYNPGVFGALVMCEQFIQPHPDIQHYSAEVDNDLLYWNGECVYGSVTDNWASKPPYFLETCEQHPSLLPAKMQEEMLQYAKDCVTALGFKNGCFHMEAIYSTTGPMLIECNPRLGGGPTNMFNVKCWGVDLAQNYFLSMMGIPINPPRFDSLAMSCAEYFINCPTTGTIETCDFLDDAKEKNDKVQGFKYFVQAGQKVKGFDTQIPDWLGTVHMEAGPDDTQALCEEIEAFVENLKYDITPEQAPSAKRRPSRKSSVLDSYI